MSTTTKDPSSAELLNETRTTFSPSHESPKKGTAFGGADDVPCLETFHERRMRRKSHYVIYITTFIMSIGFSIILTGVWPYLKKLDPSASKEFLGWVVAANPLGQMIFSPILGWYANRVGSNRSAFVVTICFSIVGNIMYALLPMVQGYGAVRAVVLASRFIVGVSGANVAICRSYIVSSTKLKERTAALSATAAAQAIGFILGPMIQSGITMGFEQSGAIDGNSYSVSSGSIWNMYSAVGWAGAAICSVNLLLYLPCVYQEHYIATKESLFMSHTQDEPSGDSRLQKNKNKVDMPALIVILYNFYISQMLFVLIETLLVPIAMDMYGLVSSRAVFLVGFGIASLGMFCFFVFAAVSFMSKRQIMTDRQMYLFLGFLPMIIAVAMHFPVGSTYPVLQECSSPRNQTVNETWPPTLEWSANPNEAKCTLSEIGCPISQKWCKYTPIISIPQLVIGEILAFSGYAVAYALSTSLMSKVLGPKPQGIWMGILTSIGGLSRISGPLFVTYVYTELGPRWVFGTLAIVLLISALLVSAVYKRLGSSPNKINKAPASTVELQEQNN